MLRLASLLYAIISTTLAGTAIVVSLVMGYDTMVPILIAAAAGFGVAVPAAYLIARQILPA